MLTMMVLVGTGWAVTPAGQITIESQCHEEAENYGIPPEQLNDYVDSCILSRSGLLPSFPQDVSSEFPPPEEAVIGEPPTEEPGQPELIPEQGGEIQ